MKVFTGEITEEFVIELIHNPFDEEDKIKWFSIFFMDEDKYVFSAEHYGCEFAAECSTKKEVECTFAGGDSLAKHDFGIIDSFEENKWSKANSCYQSQELQLLIEKLSNAISEDKHLIHYGI
ncbi:hypothetical protein [Proteiniborus sp.]|uniref:hypothetical protein n=1 Tax=Proteiniborus sp. TaxID=2079015 RepID=UPI0033273454